MYIRAFNSPITGQTFRVVPLIGHRKAAGSWKFWTEGKEIYATARQFGPIIKFSIHHSGQIHARTGAEGSLAIAPALPVENGPWLNALELRFLTSEDATAPPEESLNPHDVAYGIDVPHGHFLYLNVLVARGVRAPVPAPQSPGMHVLWSTTLSTQEPVALIGRYMAYDAEKNDRHRYTRREPTADAIADMPVNDPPYVELRDLRWGPSGNVVYVVPWATNI